MVNGEHTRHYLSAFGNVFQGGVVHATSLGRYNLLLLMLLAGTLTQRWSFVIILPRGQTAVTCKVPQVTTIVTWVVVEARTL